MLLLSRTRRAVASLYLCLSFNTSTAMKRYVSYMAWTEGKEFGLTMWQMGWAQNYSLK